MKKFIFVSDFDGTLTEKDFYKIIMEEYLKEDCKKLYNDWRNKKIKDIDYLGYVFKSIGRNEKEILEDFRKVTATIAKAFAECEFEKYRIIQDNETNKSILITIRWQF